jgi:hypothetical protein
MTPSIFYSSPGEVSIPDLLEIKAHHIVYSNATPQEQAILLYKADITRKDPVGFYTLADVPDEDLELVHLLNADLKHWLIFYGAPEPGTLEWWTVVVHHRTRTIQDKCAAMYYRYTAVCAELFPGEAVVQ